MREPELLPVGRGLSPPVNCLALKVFTAQRYSPTGLMESPLGCPRAGRLGDGFTPQKTPVQLKAGCLGCKIRHQVYNYPDKHTESTGSVQRFN